jgi:hypothetical protein
VTDEQRSRRPIFIATLRAVASWLFFRVAHSLRINSDMLVVRALKNSQLTDGESHAIYGTGHWGVPHGKAKNEVLSRRKFSGCSGASPYPEIAARAVLHLAIDWDRWAGSRGDFVVLRRRAESNRRHNRATT